jgi:hypothetical protein
VAPRGHTHHMAQRRRGRPLGGAAGRPMLADSCNFTENLLSLLLPSAPLCPCPACIPPLHRAACIPPPQHTHTNASPADIRGRKLSDAEARDVADRLQGIVDDVCRTTTEGEFSEVGLRAGGVRRGAAVQGSARRGAAVRGSARRGAAVRGSARRGAAVRGSARRGAAAREARLSEPARRGVAPHACRGRSQPQERSRFQPPCV